VYFHVECLRAAATAFLSVRHVEMLYATLAAWGMHRMGGTDGTKTKLTDWERFHGSIIANAERLESFRGWTLLGTTEKEYLNALSRLRPVYETLDLTASGRNDCREFEGPAPHPSRLYPADRSAIRDPVLDAISRSFGGTPAASIG
jgi:hypothetical protein